MSRELRPDDERLREILGDPEGVIVSWLIVARVAGLDQTGGLIIATDDNCDVVTHMGLAASAQADATDRVVRLGEDED